MTYHYETDSSTEGFTRLISPAVDCSFEIKSVRVTAASGWLCVSTAGTMTHG